MELIRNAFGTEQHLTLCAEVMKYALIACADNPKLRHFVGTGVLQENTV